MFTISRRMARVFASFSAWTSSISSADRPFMSSISSSAPILPLWKMKEKAIYYQVIVKNSSSLSNYYLDDRSPHPSRHEKWLSAVCLQNRVFILFFPLRLRKKKKRKEKKEKKSYPHISGTVNCFWIFATSLNHIQWGILNSFIYTHLYTHLILNISLQVSTHF